MSLAYGWVFYVFENRFFNNLHGSSNELVFFDDPKNKLNSYSITLQPNTGMEDTETRRLDSQVAYISTNQTEIPSPNPPGTIVSSDLQPIVIDEFEPQFVTETPGSISNFGKRLLFESIVLRNNLYFNNFLIICTKFSGPGWIMRKPKCNLK